MKINNEGLTLLKSLEGCRLKAYKLKGERNYTIGYGHSDSTIKEGMCITQAQADSYLVNDLAKFEKYVTNYAVKKFPEINENQFSALVSYCYNRGLGGLKELLEYSDSITMLGNNITIFWGKNKNYKSALIKRREKEQALFNKSVNTISKNVSRETFKGLSVPSPTLRRGSRGTQVLNLQKFLKASGYYTGKLDGSFGELTFKALYNFQRVNSGCGTPDGVFGKHTYDVVRNIIMGG